MNSWTYLKPLQVVLWPQIVVFLPLRGTLLPETPESSFLCSVSFKSRVLSHLNQGLVCVSASNVEGSLSAAPRAAN